MTQIDLFFNMRTAPFGTPHAALYPAMLDICSWADALSTASASVLLGEHHGTEDGYLPSPVVAASAIAGRTRRLRTTVILLLPLHHPLRLAEDLAVLDLVGGGRTTFVFAAGYLEEEFSQFRVALGDRGRLMEEGIGAIKEAWTGEPFEFRGAPARVTPRPKQEPRPPIIMAGSSTGAARRAARIADGFAPTTNPALAEAYRDALAAVGNEPGPALALTAAGSMEAVVAVSSDPEEAWRKVGPHCLQEINTYADWVRRGYDSDAAFGDAPPYFIVNDLDELRASGRYLSLTPDECVAFARSRGGRLPLHPLVSGLAPAQAWKTLATIEREVLPALTDDRVPRSA